MLIYQHVLGKEGLIKQLSKRILERVLEAEMEGHLGYER
jgi:transposase-like protein